jgi:hypothetical protein
MCQTAIRRWFPVQIGANAVEQPLAAAKENRDEAWADERISLR